MEREYAKTPDLSRGQGTGMQSFEREIGKHWSNVISLRWEYLQLSRNFSRLWLLCPCQIWNPCVSRWTWGSSPSYCLYKVCFWYADASKAQVIWACSYGNTSCNTHSPGCFTPNLCRYGSLHCSPPSCSLYKPQGPWCIFHTGFPRCEILKQPVLLGMTSLNPQFSVRGIFFHQCVYCMEQRHRSDSHGSRNVFTSFG